jgi:hypothetical protein
MRSLIGDVLTLRSGALQMSKYMASRLQVWALGGLLAAPRLEWLLQHARDHAATRARVGRRHVGQDRCTRCKLRLVTRTAYKLQEDVGLNMIMDRGACAISSGKRERSRGPRARRDSCNAVEGDL